MDDPYPKNTNNEKKFKTKEIKRELSHNNIQFKSNPKNIQFSQLVTESYVNEALDNTFLVFQSIDNNLYLIYTNLDNSIISYNVLDNKKIIEIKNSNYWSYITNFRHYKDKKNKRDLVISLSYDNSLKLWNANNWEILLNINYINKVGYLYSACFLNDNEQIYIVTSNYYLDNDSENIKVFDLKGNIIKYIYFSFNDNTYFIDSYYDKKFHNNYIIAGNIDYVTSYNFNENKLYHKYDDNSKDHNCLVINEKNDEVNLIESGEDGNIRIWDFHKGKLMKKIKISNNALYGLCLWNKDYIFIGCKDKTIKLLDLQNEKVINSLEENNTRVLCIKKIIHHKYGECLFSQGYGFNQILLWTNKE